MAVFARGQGEPCGLLRLTGFVARWRPVASLARLFLFGYLEFDRQLVRLHLDADDVGIDEVSVISLCGILEMLADGTSDESFDLGRRHPAHGSGTPGPPLEKG